MRRFANSDMDRKGPRFRTARSWRLSGPVIFTLSVDTREFATGCTKFGWQEVVSAFDRRKSAIVYALPWSEIDSVFGT